MASAEDQANSGDSLRIEIDGIVSESIAPVSLGLAILFALFSINHILFLHANIAPAMSVLAGASALIAFGVWLADRVRPLAPTAAHPVGLGLFTLALFNITAHMVLAQDVQPTTYLMLTLVGAGFVLLSTPWFLVALVMGAGAWLVGLNALPALGEDVLPQSLGLLGALVLSVIVHTVHLRATQNFQRARLMETKKGQELGRFFSLSLDMLGTLGFDGYLKQINFAFERALGARLTTIYETPFIDLIHPDDREMMMERLDRMEVGTELEHFESRIKCGASYKWVLWNAVSLPEQRATYLAGRDITFRKKAEDDLQQAYRELSALNAIMRALTSTLEPESVFQEIVGAVDQLLPHVRGATLQVMEGGNKLVTRAWTNRLKPEVLTFRVGEGAAGLAAIEGRTVNIADTRTDPRFAAGARPAPFLSLMAVPLTAADKVVGVISVEGEEVSAFGSEEERKIRTLADYAAVVVENSRLYKEHAMAEETLKNYTDHLQEIVEARTTELRSAEQKLFAQRQIEQEIELAHEVQASLLARQIPHMDGFVIAATGLPARFVGGDFYDFIQKEDSCNIILADISGKGVSAAMLTSTARAMVRAAIEHESEPAGFLMASEKSIYSDLNHAEMFATFFAARLDVKTAALTYANAGHTEAIWWRHKDQACDRLPATGLPIGILPDNEITQRQIHLSPGDSLVLYSDGVTETSNPKGELFGIDRLIDLVATNGDDSAHTLAQRILTEVDLFAGGAPLADDLTLVVLKIMPRSISFKYPARLSELDEIVGFIRNRTVAYGREFAYQTELAVSELATNIIKYAYRKKTGEIRGDITLADDGITLDLYDDGHPFDPADLKPPDLENPHVGGYGLHIIRQAMDDLQYDSGPAGANHWRLVKKIKPSEPRAAIQDPVQGE